MVEQLLQVLEPFLEQYSIVFALALAALVIVPVLILLWLQKRRGQAGNTELSDWFSQMANWRQQLKSWSSQLQHFEQEATDLTGLSFKKAETTLGQQSRCLRRVQDLAEELEELETQLGLEPESVSTQLAELETDINGVKPEFDTIAAWYQRLHNTQSDNLQRLEKFKLTVERLSEDIQDAERLKQAWITLNDRKNAGDPFQLHLDLNRFEERLAPAAEIQSQRDREAERLAAEKAEAEQREAERVAAEKAEAEQREAERLAAEKAEAEQREAERLAAEKAEAEKREAERLAAEKAEAEQREAERLAAGKAEEAKREAERLAAEKAEAEQREAERLAAEKAEAEQREAERLAAEKAEAEQREAERLAAEKAEAEQREAERLAAEKAEAEQREAETTAVSQASEAELAAAKLLQAKAAAELEAKLQAATPAEEGSPSVAESAVESAAESEQSFQAFAAGEQELASLPELLEKITQLHASLSQHFSPETWSEEEELYQQAQYRAEEAKQLLVLARRLYHEPQAPVHRGRLSYKRMQDKIEDLNTTHSLLSAVYEAHKRQTEGLEQRLMKSAQCLKELKENNNVPMEWLRSQAAVLQAVQQDLQQRPLGLQSCREKMRQVEQEMEKRVQV